MALPGVRKAITELATVLFGLGLTVVGSAENTGYETLRLWSALSDLDKYARELELNWSKLYEETSAVISREMDRVLDIVKEAQDIRGCAHYEEKSAPETGETGCTMCGLRVQLISIKLQQRIVRLQSQLRATRLGP